MKVLLTGGTGVIGEGAIMALLERGFEVRVLTRHADRDTRRWPHGVEALTGDVASRASVTGAADGCDVIVHVAGIATEEPPDATFEKVNVGGTRNVVAEAERARVARLVFVSSLGADRGTSAYHRSKAKAEAVVRRCTRPWTIVRPGNVYGPRDGALSALLRMVRTLPAVPMVGDGQQLFQPIWYEDLGRALAVAVDAEGAVGRALDVAGPDQTTLAELIDRMEALTGRKVARVRVPAGVAAMGLQVAGILGVPVPVTETHVALLEEQNVVAPGRENALRTVFRVRATPLDEGLRRLAGEQPEQVPAEGVGPLQHKRYWADIQNAYYRARELRDVFRREIASILPLVSGQKGGPITNLKKNQTFLVTLPLRGVVPMRVEDVSPDRVTAVTVEGHPLAGVITFQFVERGREVRFLVEVHARGADVADAIVMQTVGSFLQDVNWRTVVERVIAVSGGTAPGGVQMETRALDDDEARRIEQWVDGMVLGRKRGEAPAPRLPSRPRAAHALTAARAAAPAKVSSRSPRRPAGTGSARRSRAGSGSARTSGRTARPAGARTGSRRSS